jgi:hypothetical protein
MAAPGTITGLRFAAIVLQKISNLFRQPLVHRDNARILSLAPIPLSQLLPRLDKLLDGMRTWLPFEFAGLVRLPIKVFYARRAQERKVPA